MESNYAIRFTDVCRYYGTVHALDHVSFDVADGEFFSMLGPSGSGKTTSLRLIAGFETPTSGQILIHGTRADGVPPYNRNVNTVFQDYALFPHMTILENVSYGLMVKGMKKKEYIKKAQEMLALVKLRDMGSRKPSQLSGGQRQRVALARALVNQPRVLLLDEPLGALDLKLRKQMQIELKSLQRELGITFIYVTHDQDEALSMSDRLAVFRRGQIEQIGTPRDVYEYPDTPFVADFVGNANIIEKAAAQKITGTSAAFAVRPEKVRLAPDNQSLPPDHFSIRGKISDIHYHGAGSMITLTVDEDTSVVLIQPHDSTDGSLAENICLGAEKTVMWHRDDNREFKGTK
ncbi:ABC transporter ATP-binding protein [uncultured Desulfobacter sp.]|uniref:ABC transporter ATP-binding protein n=1 Tax=uncultured Desulfobacter sp. TaxID=240139 RepID=UPI002AAB4194|nr:ABC transporter ATP-binding protein [uncultured Desulfobacter sp.]